MSRLFGIVNSTDAVLQFHSHCAKWVRIFCSIKCRQVGDETVLHEVQRVWLHQLCPLQHRAVRSSRSACTAQLQSQDGRTSKLTNSSSTSYPLTSPLYCGGCSVCTRQRVTRHIRHRARILRKLSVVDNDLNHVASIRCRVHSLKAG